MTAGDAIEMLTVRPGATSSGENGEFAESVVRFGMPTRPVFGKILYVTPGCHIVSRLVGISTGPLLLLTIGFSDIGPDEKVI